MCFQWKVISSSVWCCCNKEKEEELAGSSALEDYDALKLEKDLRNFSHPSDSQIALTSHTPLFPPGRIIHIVRNHPKNSGLVLVTFFYFCVVIIYEKAKQNTGYMYIMFYKNYVALEFC